VLQPSTNQVDRAFQVHPGDLDAFGQDRPIPLLERGACNDQILAAFETVPNTGMDCGEPRGAIGIRQRNTMAHLVDVLIGVQ
jgi:hypothetical protein